MPAMPFTAENLLDSRQYGAHRVVRLLYERLFGSRIVLHDAREAGFGDSVVTDFEHPGEDLGLPASGLLKTGVITLRCTQNSGATGLPTPAPVRRAPLRAEAARL